MLKTTVTYSVGTDEYNIGENVAKKLDNPKISFLFMNADMNCEKAVKGFASIHENKPIIGCTSSNGIITQNGFISDKNYVGVMSFHDDNMVVGVAGSQMLNTARDTGKKVARAAINKAGIKKVPSFFYFVANPKYEEEYLKGIEDVIGTVPYFGGSAADNTYEGKWKIICNENIFSNGCAVAFFYTKSECKTVFTGEYLETDKVGVVTKVDNKRYLCEIDGEPATKKYSEWAGLDLEKVVDKGLTLKTVTKPLGVKDPLGRLTLIRYPMIFNSNGSIYMGNEVTEKTAVILMNTDKETIIESVKNNLELLKDDSKREFQSYFLIFSGFKSYYLKEQKEKIYRVIKDILGDSEFIMIFTFGEYGSNEHTFNSISNLSLSFTGFSD